MSVSVERIFWDSYEYSPSFVSQAPGRVELLGTDTDDSEGYVLSMAIDRHTFVAFGEREGDDDRRCRIISVDLDSRIEFTAPKAGKPKGRPPEGMPHWGSYVYGVVDLLAETGISVPGFDAVIQSTVPIGGGLSSSASLELAFLGALLHAAQATMGILDRALLAQKAEHRYAGVNCGLLDQYSCGFGEQGNAMMLDCRSQSHINLRIPPDIMIVVGNTNVSRALADSEYGLWKEQCLDAAAQLSRYEPRVHTLRDLNPKQFDELAGHISDEVIRSRARFIVEENNRVPQMALAIINDDRPMMGQLTAASFAGMRDLYGKTIAEMEHMYEAMTAAPGCLGARQSGGGFGGCLLAYVESDRVDAFIESVDKAYRAATGILPTLFSVEAAGGPTIRLL